MTAKDSSAPSSAVGRTRQRRRHRRRRAATSPRTSSGTSAPCPSPSRAGKASRGCTWASSAPPSRTSTSRSCMDVVVGDKIAAQMSWTATHKGDFLGIPATGRTVDSPGHRRSSASPTARSPRSGCRKTSWASTSSSHAPEESVMAEADNMAVAAAATTTRSSTREPRHHRRGLHRRLPARTTTIRRPAAGTRRRSSSSWRRPWGFPDITLTVEDIFAEGDLAASRWMLAGTNTAPCSATRDGQVGGMGGRRPHPVRGGQDRRGLVQLRPDEAPHAARHHSFRLIRQVRPGLRTAA